jgi:hypothetical protein
LQAIAHRRQVNPQRRQPMEQIGAELTQRVIAQVARITNTPTLTTASAAPS